MVSTQWTRLVPPCTGPTGMEESDPVNGWPQRTLRLWDMMMMMILYHYFGESAQSYFPPQIVFSTDNGQTVIAIDEINQRAYQSVTYSFSSVPQISYALQHFPYATPDSPQAKYYVQLLLGYSSLEPCMYATYWKYGGNYFNVFPSHWLNGSSLEIKNYVNFTYKRIHSDNSSPDEDYWYTNEKCEIQDGSKPPCQERTGGDFYRNRPN
ncbi:unnamed protein product [Rotaria sp. Silwood2]|nr:unnamed protein product [Rotaria sp. Silwood2]